MTDLTNFGIELPGTLSVEETVIVKPKPNSSLACLLQQVDIDEFHVYLVFACCKLVIDVKILRFSSI